MGIATGLCLAATLPLWLGRRDLRPAPTPLALPALLWIVALVLSAAFAVDRAGSLPRLGKALFPPLAILAAFHAARPATGRRAVAAYLASSALASAFGLALFVAKGASFHSRARGAVGHYITFAGQCLLVLCLAAGIALVVRDRRWRTGALVSGALAALALGATFTRGAWVGAALGLATLAGVAKPRRIPLLAGAIVLAVVLAPAPYRARLASIANPADATNRERTLMWEAGGRMFRDHPVTGVGLMDLKPLYERYRSPEATERAGHLHSVPVHLAATTGVVGLVAYAALAVGLLASAFAGARATLARGGLAAGVRLGIGAAIVAFLVAGLFEWNLGDEELLYPLYALAGIAWAARDWPADEASA